MWCNCDWCGKKIYIINSRYKKANHHFCNHECELMFRHHETHETRVCLSCGKEFECLKSSRHKFCCVECQHEWQKTGERTKDGKLIPCLDKKKSFDKKKPAEKATCDYCGKEYKKRHRYITNNHFCSNECFAAWRQSENNPMRKRKVTCVCCGKEFFVTYQRYKTSELKFCSKECYNKSRKMIWTEERRKHQSEKNAQTLKKGTHSGLNSFPQVKINELLSNLNIKYINEYSISSFSIDNYLPDYNLFIEVMGDFWHANPCIYNEIKYDQQKHGCARDKKKRTYMKEYIKKDTLNLWEYDIRNDLEKCEKLIELYINKNGILKDYNSFNYTLVDNELILNDNIVVPFFEREDILENIA